MKKRLDVLLVERGLAESRAQAQALVLAGLVPGYDKPGQQVEEGVELEVERGPRFVSRGGDKLDNALDAFGIDVTGLDALDVGASTGGFTDVLLQRGAARVIAVDVGYGQLAWSLQSDERVTVMDRTNVRELTLEQIGGKPVDLVVGDLSFISLGLVLPALAGCCAEDGAAAGLAAGEAGLAGPRARQAPVRGRPRRDVKGRRAGSGGTGASGARGRRGGAWLGRPGPRGRRLRGARAEGEPGVVPLSGAAGGARA